MRVPAPCRRPAPWPTLFAASVFAAFSLLALSTLPALAAPEPAPVPKRWEFDAQFSPLRITTVAMPEGGTRAYFYLTFKVTNLTGHDRLFVPSFELATDSGKVYRSGRDVPVAVVRDILDRLENPFLEDQIKITDTLLQGRENAKEGLIVWPAAELKLEEIKVYAGGFSGETATIEIPDAETGTKTKVVLRKTKELVYRPGGEIDPAREHEVQLIRDGWIMR